MENVNVLIDLGHPAHLHFFRHAAQRLTAEGHTVRFTGRDKDILVELARGFGIEVEVFGVCKRGTVHMAGELAYRQWRLAGIVRRFKPDVMLGIAGTYISAVGRLFGVPTYIFYDTEHATLSNMLAYPFATCTFVPQCYHKPIRWRNRRYNGYHELAYLHPKYFQADPAVLDEVGLGPSERFSIVRFVGWGAVHDVGLSGLTDENKTRAIDELCRFGRVFISSEGPLPASLEEHRLRLDVTRIHHLMAHADLVFGESATMASEAAVLGVPSVYIDPVGRGYTDEQEREYGLVANFTAKRQAEAIDRAVAVLAANDRAVWKEAGRKLIDDKIDVTGLVCRVATERPYVKPVTEPDTVPYFGRAGA